MGSSKAPKTPDYTGAAQAQGLSDMQTAQYLTQANRVNQIDPYGQTIWTQEDDPSLVHAQSRLDWVNDHINNPDKYGFNQDQVDYAKSVELPQAQSGLTSASGKGKWTQTTTLTPAQQALLEQQQGIQGQQNTRTSQLLNDFQTPTLKDANPNNIQSLMYDQLTKDYGDRFAKDEASQKAQLANQGFQAGSEGYNDTLNDFTKNKNSAYGDAATQAALASYNQYNTERGQNLNDYNSQMGYLSQLLGGVQGPTMPQYQPYAQATPYQSPDMMGAMQGQYQGDLNQTNAQNASRSQTLGTVGTIASVAAIAF